MMTMTVAPTSDGEITLEESVPVSRIFLDRRYGKEPVESALDRMIRNWDWASIGVIYLSLREDGSYACLDGWHRVLACRTVEGDDACIPARVYIDLTVAEEAAYFDKFNRWRVMPTAGQTWKARLAAEDEKALLITGIVSGLGLQLATDRTKSRNIIRSVAVIEGLYDRFGAELFREALRLCRDAFGTESAAFSGVVVKGIAMFLDRYSKDRGDGVFVRAELMQRLKDVGVSGLVAKAHLMRSARSGGLTMDTALGQAVLDVYNFRRSKGRLGEWRTRVFAEGVRERAKRLDATGQRTKKGG